MISLKYKTKERFVGLKNYLFIKLPSEISLEDLRDSLPEFTILPTGGDLTEYIITPQSNQCLLYGTLFESLVQLNTKRVVINLSTTMIFISIDKSVCILTDDTKVSDFFEDGVMSKPEEFLKLANTLQGR